MAYTSYDYGYTGQMNYAQQMPLRPYKLFKPREGYESGTTTVENSHFKYDPTSKELKFTKSCYVRPESLVMGLQIEGIDPGTLRCKSRAGSSTEPQWILLSEEKDITEAVSSTDKWISIINGGCMFGDYVKYEGLLVNDIIIEYRTTAGTLPRQTKGKFAQQRNAATTNIYAIDYLSIGIPQQFGDALQDFLQFEGVPIDDKSFSKLEQGYYWQTINGNFESMPVLLVNANRTVNVTIAEALQSLGSNKGGPRLHLVGDAHLTLKMTRNASFVGNTADPAFKVSLVPSMFQVKDTTTIGPSPIGAAKANAAIVGGATVKDDRLFSLLTSGGKMHMAGQAGVGSTGGFGMPGVGAPMTQGTTPWGPAATNVRQPFTRMPTFGAQQPQSLNVQSPSRQAGLTGVQPSLSRLGTRSVTPSELAQGMEALTLNSADDSTHEPFDRGFGLDTTGRGTAATYSE